MKKVCIPIVCIVFLALTGLCRGYLSEKPHYKLISLEKHSNEIMSYRIVINSNLIVSLKKSPLVIVRGSNNEAEIYEFTPINSDWYELKITTENSDYNDRLEVWSLGILPVQLVNMPIEELAHTSAATL